MGSGEIIVSDRKGVLKTRTIQRKPMEDRRPATSADVIGDVPWLLSVGDPEVGGDYLQVTKLEPKLVVKEECYEWLKLPTSHLTMCGSGAFRFAADFLRACRAKKSDIF